MRCFKNLLFIFCCWKVGINFDCCVLNYVATLIANNIHQYRRIDRKKTCRQEHKFRCCFSIYCFFHCQNRKKMKEQIWTFFNESTHFMCYYVHLLENWNLTGVRQEIRTILPIWWCCLEFMINHHHTIFNTIQYNSIRLDGVVKSIMIVRNNL